VIVVARLRRSLTPAGRAMNITDLPRSATRDYSDARCFSGIPYVYRMPESHRHWTFVIWLATTSTSNGPYRPILLVLSLRETL
jgi:hypothetical protein